MLEIREATPERWDDIEAVMRGGGDGGSCWCQWFRMSASVWKSTSSGERREAMVDEVAAGPVRGLIAYVDGAPSGWVRVAPKAEQSRLARSPIAKAGGTPGGSTTTWAITCFQVVTPHRGRGLMTELIRAATAFAKDAGAAAVEAYPVDTEVTQVSDDDLYHGSAKPFLGLGFVEVARAKPARPVLRLEL